MPDTPAGPATPWQPAAIIDWLITDGRFADDLDALVYRLGARLLAGGAPVWRVRLSLRTIHPLITSVTSIWERDSAAIQHVASPHGIEGRAGYAGSPLLTIVETRSPFRKRLVEGLSGGGLSGGGLSGDDHQVLHDLRARGATDYYGLPVRLTAERFATLVFVTDAPAGFSDADLAAFDRIAVALGPIVEVFRLGQLSLAVAEAYLGKRTGRRVLEGRIVRGDVERLDAAILMSDIRDWTGLNDRVPAETAIDLANRCFDLLAEAVDAHGGEILKFVGDGVLAVFPAGDDDPGAGGDDPGAAGESDLRAEDETDPRVADPAWPTPAAGRSPRRATRCGPPTGRTCRPTYGSASASTAARFSMATSAPRPASTSR